MHAIGKIWSEMNMFVAFDQMKEDSVRGDALFNIPLYPDYHS